MLSGKADPGDAPTVARRCSFILYSISGYDTVFGRTGRTGKGVGYQ